MSSWANLDSPWRATFDLMWESFAAGSIPVGAVLADEVGAVVATARNRIFEPHAPRPQLAGTRIAHAELNALAGLSSDRTYENLTLYTALEPCPLCVGAAYAVRIGHVRYAAADPYGGAVSALAPTRDMRAHPVDIEGPLPAPFGLLPELLHVAHFLWRRPDGDVVAAYREHRPDLVERAERIRRPSGSLVDALPSLLPLLS